MTETGTPTSYEPIEFDCEGCGWHVIAFGQCKVPAHGFCASCAFLCEFVPDPEAMMTMRKMLPALETEELHRPITRRPRAAG